MENEVIENEEIEAQSEEEMEVTEPETVDTSAEQDLEGEEGEAAAEGEGAERKVSSM